MFGPDAPPLPWDRDNEYTRDRVELYYLSNAGRQLKQVSAGSSLDSAEPEFMTRVDLSLLTVSRHLLRCQRVTLCPSIPARA